MLVGLQGDVTKGDVIFYTGGPEELVLLEAATAAVLAQEDPAAVLLTAPMSGGDSLGTMSWLASYLAAGGGQLSRGFAWHAYVDTPEQAAIVLPTLRQVSRAGGAGSRPCTHEPCLPGVWCTVVQPSLPVRQCPLCLQAVRWFISYAPCPSWPPALLPAGAGRLWSEPPAHLEH